MAWHDEEHHGSLRNICVATHYYKEKYQNLIDTEDSSGIGIEFYYPILVVGGELVEVMPLKRSMRFKSVDHIKYRQTLIRADNEQNYIVDVVTERALPQLLTVIEEEMTKTANKVRNRYDRFLEFARPTQK